LELEILLKGISFLLKELVHMFKAGIMGVQISLGCNAERRDALSYLDDERRPCRS